MSGDGNEKPGPGGGDTEVAETAKKRIMLPLGAGVGYVLECWKVKEGSLVRSGETVALACLASAKKNADASSTTSTAAPTTAAKHKRPSRRKLKRPAPAAASAASASTNKPAAEKENGENRSSLKLLLNKKETSADDKKGANTEASGTQEKEREPKSKGKPSLHKSIPIEAPMTGFVRVETCEDNPRAIGFIEPCSHPAIVDGMCAVCGVPIQRKSTESELDRSSVCSQSPSDPSMSQLTVSGGLTFEVSKDEQVRMGKQNAQRLRQLKKLSLVLDLDSTLVHATGDNRAQQHLGRDDVRSILLPSSEDARPGHFFMQHFVKLRPNVKEFLEGVRDGFEIGVYTAGTRQYAEQIAIILCRDMVGAERDQIHLDQLRHKRKSAEKQLAATKATKPAKTEETKKLKEADKREEPKKEEEPANKRPKEANKTKEEPKEEEERAKKRRKVTFAEPEPEGEKEKKESPKKPPVTAEDLLELETELNEAEEKEKEALDLRQRLFGSRIVSRSDVGDLGRDVKSLRRIFPCGGTMAAVVDDREDVWANAKDNTSSSNSRRGEPPENLLLVEAYHWQPFTGYAEINNAAGLNLSKESNGKAGDKPGEEHDEQLLWTKDILSRLHNRFYSQSDEDNTKTVPEILNEMRREVLAGQKIVLSGLVPLHKQNQHSNDLSRPRPDAIRYVESMGATIIPTVHPDTSFVVAARDGTDKILTARRTPGCYVVKRSWLMQCYWSLTRRDPKPHLLPSTGRDISARRAVANLSPVRDVIAAAKPKDDKDDEDSDDDDALADEFEKDFM